MLTGTCAILNVTPCVTPLYFYVTAAPPLSSPSNVVLTFNHDRAYPGLLTSSTRDTLIYFAAPWIRVFDGIRGCHWLAATVLVPRRHHRRWHMGNPGQAWVRSNVDGVGRAGGLMLFSTDLCYYSSRCGVSLQFYFSRHWVAPG